jgi:hypothetical protein
MLSEISAHLCAEKGRPAMREKVTALIKKDKLDAAIEELRPALTGKNDDLSNDLLKLQSDLARSKREYGKGLISADEESKVRARVCYRLLEILSEVEKLDEAVTSNSTPTSVGGADAPTVFISYNHGDTVVADKLKAALERNGIVVRIDKAVMEAGANIQEFIEHSIRDTDATLSIVSNRSLLSAWVALESVGTFYSEKFNGHRKFIACYIDDDFFQTDYRINATEQIDAKIAEIDRLIPKYIALKINTEDLNNQKTRLYELRNELGKILLRLRESLCVDVREDPFDQSLEKIVKAIKGSARVERGNRA